MTYMHMNSKRKFDILQHKKLGNYIYALRDPRDGKIFYVGQINNRLFDHFNNVDECIRILRPFKELSSKEIRIMDIWRNNEDVEWLILAHNLPDDVSDYVEAAIFDSLSESQNGETLNDNNPPKCSRLLPEDLKAMAADFVNPQIGQFVFLFPIRNTLSNGITPYNATRTSWNINNINKMLNPAYAVGLKNSISIGSFEISSWVNVNGTTRYEFTSHGHPDPSDYQPLLNKNWNNVLSKARGYWQRGNYLIVEFNGDGKFRIVRGSRDLNTWYDCV